MTADDVVELCPNVAPESVCRPDSTAMEQHIVKGAATSGRGNGKMLTKRVMLRLHGTSITDRCTTQFYCFPSYSFMKICNQVKTLQLLPSQYTESFMGSLIYEELMSSNFMYIA